MAELLLKVADLFGPLLVPFLAGAGLIAILIRWKQIKAFLSNAGGGARQLDYGLLKQVIEQGATCRDCMTKVVNANTEALVKVADALRENGDKLDRNHRGMMENIQLIHRRVDDALSRRAA